MVKISPPLLIYKQWQSYSCMQLLSWIEEGLHGKGCWACMFGRKKCTPDQEVKNGYIHWPALTSYIIIPEEGRLFQQHVAIIFPFTEETTCNPVVSVCALIGTTLNWHYNIFGSSCNRNCHTRSEGIAFTDRITKFTIIILQDGFRTASRRRRYV